MDQFGSAFNKFTGNERTQTNIQDQGGNMNSSSSGQNGFGNNQPSQNSNYLQQGMDFFNKQSGQQGPGSQGLGGSTNSSNNVDATGRQQNTGGFMGMLNSAAGGGPASEKNEDYLDKGVDFVQERFLGQGPQNNESALEQAKDEQISDAIRNQYKNATGRDFFIKDKETRFG